MGDEGAPEGTLAVADKQTAGRGRRGRSWASPSGSSIYMSLLLRPEIEPDQAPMLTLVMALSVAEGLMDCGDSCGNPDVKIKWPNDIIINGKNETYGFPSKVEDDPVLAFVIKGDRSIDYAEERRLFYVAITRAKKYLNIYCVSENLGCYVEPSIFMKEVMA